MRNPVNAAVFLVAERSFVSGTFACAKAARRRIVLNHVVVPINNPERSVRTDFAVDRGGPFGVAGREVAGVVSDEIGSAAFEEKLAEQVASRFGDELRAVPVLLREGASGVDAAPRTRGVASVEIDLPNFFCKGIKPLAVRNGFETRGRPAVYSLVVTIRDWHIHARVPVRL